ncbi:hypothetical protein ACFLRF_03275 [Candidatus Altiarchaeota archaeon]
MSIDVKKMEGIVAGERVHILLAFISIAFFGILVLENVYLPVDMLVFHTVSLILTLIIYFIILHLSVLSARLEHPSPIKTLLCALPLTLVIGIFKVSNHFMKVFFGLDSCTDLYCLFPALFSLLISLGIFLASYAIITSIQLKMFYKASVKRIAFVFLYVFILVIFSSIIYTILYFSFKAEPTDEPLLETLESRVDACTTITHEHYHDSCLSQLIKKNPRQHWICERMNVEWKKVICYVDAGTYSKDPTLCENIDKDDYVNQCYQRIATNLQ